MHRGDRSKEREDTGRAAPWARGAEAEESDVPRLRDQSLDLLSVVTFSRVNE